MHTNTRVIEVIWIDNYFVWYSVARHCLKGNFNSEFNLPPNSSVTLQSTLNATPS